MRYKNIFSFLFFILFLSYMHHTSAMKVNNDQAKLTKAIFLACEKGCLPNYIATCLKQDNNINIKKNNNITPLHIACKNGHPHIVKFLLENKADINAKIDDGLFTPLHCSVLNQHIMTTKQLIIAGADLDAQTMYGHTALDIAYHKKNKAIIELFPDQSGEE